MRKRQQEIFSSHHAEADVLEKKDCAKNNDGNFIHNTVSTYLDKSDWRVQENSSVNFSIGGLILHNSGTVTANYWLDFIYAKEISQAHRDGDLHIHDLSMLAGYCAGWSLRQLLQEGIGGVKDRISAKPAKHFSTAIWQIINFLGTMQNEWAGAQAFSSFDTYLAPYVKKDRLSFTQVKQNIQSFIFSVNTPSRWGCQSPFSNLTFDWVVPADLQEQKAMIAGVECSFTYGECQREADLINRAFIEIMMEGDADGRGFAYPIPTYNLTKQFNWDSENAELLFAMTAKYGTPYFQNFINSDLNPVDVRSMCCRLQLDKRELRKRGGGLFGADEMTGSIGVVTINLPRIGYLSTTDDDFFDRLDKLMELAKNSLEIKRQTIDDLMEKGLFPYSKRYLGHLKNHFSTIGLVGMNECCMNYLQVPLSHEKGKSFAIKVLKHMNNKLADFQEQTDCLYNLEATPAESTAYRLAKMDKQRWPQIYTAGLSDPYYTNSSALPVGFTNDIFSAFDHQDELQCLYTGGTVLHGYLGEVIEDVATCKNLVKKIAHNYHLPYFSITPTFSICLDHGKFSGEHEYCPYCQQEMEVYSRITGYYRPLKNWNLGKKAEFFDRQEYAIEGNNLYDEKITASK